MNIRDSYLHGVNGKGVVKSMYFATSAETVNKPDFSATYNTAAAKDLIFLLADTLGTKVGITIPTLNLNTTGYASKLLVVKRSTDAAHYLTFVDSNNDSATAENLYTDGDITYNPSTNLLTVGKITISNLLNYSNIQAATDSVNRPIWLSGNTSDAKGTPVYNSDFYFNPGEGPVGYTGTLHVNNISGQNIAINIGDPTNGGTRVVIGGTYNPVTTINSTSTNQTIPGTKAVYDAILNGIAANDAMIFKGILTGGDSLANTTYTPAADCGHVYKVGTAGYINGDYYNVNDTFICTTDSTAAATSSTSDADMTTIKSRWGIVEGNGDYLSIHGGTMRGLLKWADANALPSTTAADYILVVDATSNGTTKYITKANFKTSLSITDKTAFKLHTDSGNPGSTQKTDATVISANSSTALSIKGGTNSFMIGNGTNYITIPVAHGLTTKAITINGTAYNIYTSESALPTFCAPATLADTGGYILATNSGKTALEWVAKPAGNITTSAVVASSATGTAQITANQTDPYYNLLEGGAVTRSIQFKHGSNMAISSTTGGVITFTATNTWRAIRINSGSSNSVGTGTDTKAMNFASGNLTINYLAAGTGDGKSGSADYFTIGINAKDWTGATENAAGTAGYMPGAASADRNKFLRGDGTWVSLSDSTHTHPLSIATDSGTNALTLAASTKYKLTAGGSTFIFTTPPNTWRNIRVNGGSSDSVGTGVGTKAMNFSATGNITISYAAAGTSTGQSGSADYFTVGINAAANAVGVAGYVAAPTAANNKYNVWMTDADGVPAWRTLNLSSTATQLYNGSKSLQVDTWTTMADISGLAAGTYAIQINSGTLYASGIFTACHGTDVVIDEIVLHVANTTSGATWRPYARVSGSNLQMTTNEASGTSRTYTIKILQLI